MVIFSQTQLDAAVKVAQQAVPMGHSNAIVGTVDNTGAQVVVSMKLDADHWTAKGAIRHDWTGQNIVGASMIYSW